MELTTPYIPSGEQRAEMLARLTSTITSLRHRGQEAE